MVTPLVNKTFDDNYVTEVQKGYIPKKDKDICSTKSLYGIFSHKKILL